MSTTAETLSRTPLYANHVSLGAKMVPFAGWEMPVQYSGVIPEHLCVRSAAGLFDVSHMGEISVEGNEAEKTLDYLTCNYVTKLSNGRAHYSALLNPAGGVIDDIIIYRYDSRRYLVCVNASNAAKDFAWMVQNNRFDAEITNRSPLYGQIALQGPKAAAIAAALPGGQDIGSLEYFSFCDAILDGIPLVAARTGYTGEDGFEFFVGTDNTAALWDKLLAAGKPHGLLPVGLGARDSLRLEACYPLHGHELGEDISALESGLGWIVKLDKGEFIGADALRKDKAAGPKRALAGFFVEDAGIVRHGDKLFDAAGKEAGIVTSGTKTPTVNKPLGMALLDRRLADEGTEIFAEVRGRKLKCRIVKKPFYKKPS